MIKNTQAISAAKHGSRPAERKQVELFSKNGIASNRQGICYGAPTSTSTNTSIAKNNSAKSTSNAL
jgi:hypothetical protein